MYLGMKLDLLLGKCLDWVSAELWARWLELEKDSMLVAALDS